MTGRLRSAGAALALAAATLLSLTACARTIAGTPVVGVTTGPPVASDFGSPAAPTPTSAAVPARTPPPHPCHLVTQAEAEVLADRDLQPGVASGDEKGVPTLCQYTAPPDTPGVAQVSIGVGDGALKFLQIDRDTLGHQFTRPAGIGDEAWQEDGHIFVRKGSVWVSVELVTLDADPAIPDRLRATARIVVNRLG
jgi:hypothetical protein